MRWWLGAKRPLRTGLIAGLLIVVVLLAAKIHACACTGGRPVWRSVSSTTNQ